jgi:hypothetical protein
VITLVAFWLPSRNRIKNSVSVTFLYYTNSDTRGFNDKYKWAWFRIENKSSYSLDCQQGPLDFERAGNWLTDTSRIGFQYTTVQAGGTATISLLPPEQANKWRNTLHMMVMQSNRDYFRRMRYENFIERLYERFRFRLWQSKRPAPIVVKSSAIDL